MDQASERLDALVVAQPATYGVAVCVRQLVEAAVTAGHRVTVACPGESVGPLAGWVRTAGADVVPLDMRREPAPRDLTDAVTLLRLMRGRDLVHLHSSKAAALGRVAAAPLGRRRPVVIVTPHAWSWMVGGRMTPMYRTIERQLARWSDGLIAVSEEEAAEGRRALGSAGDRIRVIVNGVDRERFSPLGPRADRPDDGPLLLCVGRLSEQKGQDLAIRAFAMLREPRARLRFVGGEDQVGDRARLQTLAGSLGVADRVEWVDHTDDVAAHLRAADLMVAPSRWEGMSSSCSRRSHADSPSSRRVWPAPRRSGGGRRRPSGRPERPGERDRALPRRRGCVTACERGGTCTQRRLRPDGHTP